ncbi:Methylase involved in ubiquinone/menaquinone biosynthesis [Pasteurella testudinis DSM 23072]|uniref:Methylase involved in ubiquinone/menaquinone biosynthesis n=1 Tax=Pasteurella testudinis DSM 23072 TaxID=1122938 RepID=A0A1W1VAL6_9PAST|nr:class I SAM-dependent methyltransferase [Pasteurella testudinis]SMB90014.1 Methylase involved in ubiquinone/menaquinone biosynthesis [Pasteurella testudinis DSM 23072]SUB51310.1 ubiquinone/menaquinone biosynthesis methyltransferase [Pasteurella testudinis]
MGLLCPILQFAAENRRFTARTAVSALGIVRTVDRVGCGSGLDLPYLPAQSAVLAVDFSAQMLKQSADLQRQLQAQGHELALTLRQGRAEQSGLADHSVDLVLLHLILAVTDQPQALMEEAVRVLKPGGVISIWDKFAPQRIGWLRRTADYLSRKLGTTLLLQIDPLLQPHSLAIMQRHTMLYGQMQHLILSSNISVKR